MNKINGFVRWYDESSDNGHIEDFNGQMYYFNSFSFPKTMYKVTGKCKKTGKKKTIKTRHFPGLFLSRQEIKDPVTKKLTYGTRVSFNQVPDYDKGWAIDIDVDNSKKSRIEFLEYRLEGLLNNNNPDPRWAIHYERKLNDLITEIVGEQ